MAKRLLGITAVMLLMLAVTVPVFGQGGGSAVQGNLTGTVADTTGAVIVGARVTATGATGSKSMESDREGHFSFSALTPGFYSVTATKEGFKGVSVKTAEVKIGVTTALQLTMTPGAVTETVEVSAVAIAVDTTSTAVGASLPDSFFQQLPISRNVASLFYIAPGATDSGGAGHSNPSISGASGLENLYVADGVNITDSAFGGLGTFTRRAGSIGSGVNLSFIKEVSVKTSGFEPQYGQATGGVVQMITKSGGNAFHGEIGAYLAPQGAEAEYLQTDPARSNKTGFFFHRANYDFDGELGGYVPGFKNHLYFFGSFNPTFNDQYVGAALGSGLFVQHPGEFKLQTDVYNYAGKLTWKLNDSHQVEASIFGDPSHTTNGPTNLPALVLNAPNDTLFSKWNYATRNFVVRYNGTLSPTWLVNASFTWNNNFFTETPLAQTFGITDRTVSTNIHALQGIGYYENHSGDTYGLSFDTQKVVHWAGQHTLSFGYNYQRPNYDDIQTASPGRIPIPALNAAGANYLGSCTAGDPTCPKGQTAFIWSGGLRLAPATCTLCPFTPINGVPTRVYVRFGRGDFQPSDTPTYGRYHAAYANDSWQLNKHITINAGLRWEQWRMVGTGAFYTFTDNWAPRVGVSVDPWGDRKTKVYANFGRYNYQTPLDAAIRSLSGEKDIINLAFAPVSSGGNMVVNPNGSINVVPDAAHTLNLAPNGVPIALSIGASPFGTAFAPKTKMMYQNEWVIGAEHEFKNSLVLSARFIYRNMPRVLDDVSGVSPEGYVNGTMVQNYFIANPSPNVDLFPNPHETLVATAAGCAGPGQVFENPVVDVNGGTINPGTGAPWSNQGICYSPDANGNYGGEIGAAGQPIPDGIGDGFPTPTHIYKAVEIEVNKAFGNNWMLRANWRIASLTGNYEGAFRNDNGQTDPNISSLFDFTNGIIGMLGDQYAPGPLNTDRRHIVNAYVSYAFTKGFMKNFELGSGVNFQTGYPLSELANHPAYGNAGEVPIGGRGKEGRTPFSGTVNLHLERPFKVSEKSTVRLAADIFNISNSRPILAQTEASQISFATDPNPDFLKVSPWNATPGGYQRPFYARFSVRWVF
jgi:hypothetical protein